MRTTLVLALAVALAVPASAVPPPRAAPPVDFAAMVAARVAAKKRAMHAGHGRPGRAMRRERCPEPVPRLVEKPRVPVDTLEALRARLMTRFGSPEGRRKTLGVRELEPYPVLIFHDEFDFETLPFGIRLYDRADYRFQRPVDCAVTIDEGGLAAPAPDARYEEVEPALALAQAPSGPIVVSRACPEFPPPYRNRPRVPRPPDVFPPDVLVGRLDAQGWVVPALALPSIQAGWRYAYDPFTRRVMRVHAGRFFGPPDGASEVARTIHGRDLKIRDAEGRLMCGAHLAIAHLPAEPEGILVVEYGGLSIPIATSGPRERSLTEDLRALPGEPISTRRVQFNVQVFRPEGVDLEPDGLRLLPHALP